MCGTDFSLGGTSIQLDGNRRIVMTLSLIHISEPTRL